MKFQHLFSGFFACLFLLVARQPMNTNIESTKKPMTTTPAALAFVVRPASSLSLDGDWRFINDAQKKVNLKSGLRLSMTIQPGKLFLCRIPGM